MPIAGATTALPGGKHKIYVKTWSDVFAEFEIKHDFLLNKLEFERNKLISENKTADEIIQGLAVNSAVGVAELEIPK